MSAARTLSCALAAVLGLVHVNAANGNPVSAPYTDDGRCDAIPNQTLTEELGELPFFPLDEQISSSHVSSAPVVCVADDGDSSNDYEITITNLSGLAWTNLFYVVDQFDTVGNADGTISDGITSCDAFKIDAAGSNANLVSESAAADGVFAPGEVWVFRVTNLVMSPTLPTTPTPFDSLGFCSASFATFSAHGSIVAELAPGVPALSRPALIGLTLLFAGCGGWLAARWRRRPATGV